VHRLALHAVLAEAVEQHGTQVAHGAPHRAAVGPLAHRRELGQAREQRFDLRLLRCKLCGAVGGDRERLARAFGRRFFDAAHVRQQGERRRVDHAGARHVGAARHERPARAALPGGERFQAMPAFGPLLDDRQLADLATWLPGTWGGVSATVTQDEARAVRSTLP
jgi:hypothetical protein